MTSRAPDDGCFGVLACYADANDLLVAVRRAKAAGYARLEAYGPTPMEEVADLIDHDHRLPAIVLAGGILGGVGGFALQMYAAAVDYPQNVGGRPDASWPAFLVVAFEMLILGAALAAVLGMLALNGLPRPHHPLFAVSGFERATRDRFFLLIHASDDAFDRERTARFLEDEHALDVAEVPAR